MMSRLEKLGYVLFFIAIPLLVAGSPIFVQDIPYLISIMAAILVVYLGVLTYYLNSKMRILDSRIAHLSVVEPIHEIDFYDRFVVSVNSAQHKVDISYLHNKSPYSSQDTRKKRYYNDIVNTIKKKKKVDFKRIIRAIPDNIEWIDKMSGDFKGVANFSLACILDERSEEESVDAISVQLIDNNVTYLVAVGEQKQRRDPRDAYVESESFNQLWSRYYERLWDRSEIIIDRGCIDEKKLKKVKSHINRIPNV